MYVVNGCLQLWMPLLNKSHFCILTVNVYNYEFPCLSFLLFAKKQIIKLFLISYYDVVQWHVQTCFVLAKQECLPWAIFYQISWAIFPSITNFKQAGMSYSVRCGFCEYLKVMSTTFLLGCFLWLKESTFEIRKIFL